LGGVTTGGVITGCAIGGGGATFGATTARGASVDGAATGLDERTRAGFASANGEGGVTVGATIGATGGGGLGATIAAPRGGTAATSGGGRSGADRFGGSAIAPGWLTGGSGLTAACGTAVLGGDGKLSRSLGWSAEGRGADTFAAAAIFCPG